MTMKLSTALIGALRFLTDIVTKRCMPGGDIKRQRNPSATKELDMTDNYK